MNRHIVEIGFGLALMASIAAAASSEDVRLLEALAAKDKNAMAQSLLNGADRTVLESSKASEIFSTYTSTEYRETAAFLSKFIEEKVLTEQERLSRSLFQAVSRKDVKLIGELTAVRL